MVRTTTLEGPAVMLRSGLSDHSLGEFPLSVRSMVPASERPLVGSTEDNGFPEVLRLTLELWGWGAGGKMSLYALAARSAARIVRDRRREGQRVAHGHRLSPRSRGRFRGRGRGR